MSTITPCQVTGFPSMSRISCASSWNQTTRPSAAIMRYSLR